jgi:hypothetical protein
MNTKYHYIAFTEKEMAALDQALEELGYPVKAWENPLSNLRHLLTMTSKVSGIEL